jgi:hypothetical protein
MHIKVHQSYRKVIGIADSDLIGKKFEEGKFQLDVRENFYKGQEMSEEELIKFMQRQAKEDASFNIVGKESISAAIKAGIIAKHDMGHISGIPYALTLL